MNSSNRFLSWPSSGEYICHYEVTTTPTECLCPPGTKNYGADLYQAVLNDRLTCADAKVRYCDADNVPECRENCVNNKYCPNDHTIEITGCVNSGESYSSCVSKLCNGTGKFVCPPGTLLHDMDITNCVQSKISKGYSERNAKNYCEKKVCNFNNIVIYRTIDLKNPFPSIDADATISQTGLYYGMFNLNVRGRYPGYNWNGAQLVRKEILQNRNVSSYEIYNKKPLYHFELDTSTILEIREYNKRQATHDDGYNDFTLQCVSTETNKYVGTACLSRFVHDIRYGGDTTGSKSLCGGAGTTTTLANCLYTASNS